MVTPFGRLSSDPTTTERRRLWLDRVDYVRENLNESEISDEKIHPALGSQFFFDILRDFIQVFIIVGLFSN